ncbi:glycoside hydrolase domain-containing protein, partial [Bacteroides fragilis]|uniref:glycoside hydrolase domain-containing protein n=1 Tax=Bacteroides fragilis TaxID=817 RepID=UPI000A4EA882
MNKLLIMRTHLLWIGVMTASSLWLSGCTQEEKYPFFPEKGYDSGTVIPIKISMAENGEYDSYTPENDMAPRYNAPLIAEWAGVQTLSRTRTKESPEYNGPRIASMELTENTPSTLTTRANTLSTGVYFRLIVFRKSGNNYVFQSAADYTSNGASSPVLKKGKLLTRSGTIRVIGYSFGEYFKYEKSPEYWLTDVSGIPFGMMSEMLQDGGNPYRGMLYGMTAREPMESVPSQLWKV